MGVAYEAVRGHPMTYVFLSELPKDDGLSCDAVTIITKLYGGCDGYHRGHVGLHCGARSNLFSHGEVVSL